MNIHEFHACNSSSRPDTIKEQKKKKERENREKGASQGLIESQVCTPQYLRVTNGVKVWPKQRV